MASGHIKANAVRGISIIALFLLSGSGCGNHEETTSMSKAAQAEELYRKGTQLLETDPQGAVAYLTESLELAPEHAPARYNRAATYGRLGQYDQAIVDVEYLESHHPDVGQQLRRQFMMAALAMADMAMDDFLAKNFTASLKKCDDALLLDVNCSEAWALKGRVLVELGKQEEGLSCLDEAVRQHPDCFFSWVTRGKVFAKLQQYQEALEAYNKALELRPGDALAYEERSQVNSALGKTDEAEQDKRQAQSLRE